MADTINIVNELNTIDEHGENVINKFGVDWDNVLDKPALRPYMVGEIIRFPKVLTQQEQEVNFLLPMDGRELENVEPYRELYAFLCEYGEGEFPVIIPNKSEFTYICYGPVGNVYDPPEPVLSLQTSGTAFNASITANFDSSVQLQDMIGQIDWPDGTNTQISANGTFSKSIDASVGIVNIFGNMTYLKINNSFKGSILGGDTSRLTNMVGMFSNCFNLTGSIPNFNTSNVTTMGAMFYNCRSFTGSIPDFDTSNVRYMNSMFSFCNNLTGSIPNFNTINVTNMAQMFQSCNKLTGPIPDFNISNVINTYEMFSYCNNLIGSIPNFDTSKVIYMYHMFAFCNNLTGSIPNFNTSNATSMGHMFHNCCNLTGSIPNFNTTNVGDMYNMFSGCFNLTGSIPNFDTINVYNMRNMFYNCFNLTGYPQFTGTWAQGKGTA